MCLSVKGIYLPGRRSSRLAMENEDGCTTIKFYSQTPASAFRSPESPSPSPQWWLIAVILEILCLALLTTARIFGANSWFFLLLEFGVMSEYYYIIGNERSETSKAQLYDFTAG
ncbi:hypothetical protein KIL84_018338 [Mauremys mutica]|uniref:Uncharacterized protein n=1 Tax=Mauremys mutica TaxID=74926 RepID=A0A9D3XQ58_9SAUR|nr:hypothetical protein KIL84_018338 [Mauremys mutica]